MVRCIIPRSGGDVFRASEIVVVFRLTANPEISPRTGKSEMSFPNGSTIMRQSYRTLAQAQVFRNSARESPS
jgi:hypothetical protein